MRILNLVTDRAKALIKLGQQQYLNAFSCPDLFHFQLDMGKLAGMQIGRKYQQAQKKKQELNRAVPEASQEAQPQIEQEIKQTEDVYVAYRKQTQTINQAVHPFNFKQPNEWTLAEELEKSLLLAVRTASHLAEQLHINVKLEKATKLLNQIPDIVQGVQQWITYSQDKIETWVQQGVLYPQEKDWFSQHLLPAIYWRLQLQRTKNSQNRDLVAPYEQKAEQSEQAALAEMEHLELSQQRQEFLYQKAYQLAATFQRSSSQVEGRNGYLAFIHHGQKGIPAQKMKALTVIHNFDTRRDDGTTPAQRLYRKEFPDLFEFLCQNVTGFKEPRRRKVKPLNVNFLQR